MSVQSYRGKEKLYVAFIDLEKTYNRVNRDTFETPNSLCCVLNSSESCKDL